jgi:hypothetical protein
MNVPHFLTPYVEERTVYNNEGDVSQKINLQAKQDRKERTRDAFLHVSKASTNNIYFSTKY